MRKFVYLYEILALGLLLVGCGDSTLQVGDSLLSYHQGEGQSALTVKTGQDGDPDAVLMRGQGYAHASHRFRQMDITRRISTARLSELFGPEAMDTGRTLNDVTIWAVGIPLSTRNTMIKLEAHPEIMKLLNAYADGVNQYIAEMPTRHPKDLAFYRKLTRDPSYIPAAWEPSDSVALGVQLGYLLSASLDKKALLGMLYLSAGMGTSEEKVKDILDLRPLEEISILKVEQPVVPYRESQRRGFMRFLPFGSNWDANSASSLALGGIGGFNVPGSNNWVVSADYAGGGKTLLANDPHLLLTFPSTFSVVALDSKKAGGSFHVRGLVPAGIPGVLIGHNDEIAWGFTNSMSDVDEIYAENFDSENPLKARFNGKFIDVLQEEHTFYVRQPDGSLAEEKRTMRIVPGHGPVVSDHIPQFQRIRDAIPNLEFSYKWTGHEGSTEILALLGLNRAQNFAEFKTALQSFEVGAQNIVYGDREGNIGYYSHGNFPLRPYLDLKNPVNKNKAAHEISPPFIPNMSYGEEEWAGWRKNLPEIYNPSKGFIATANNDPYGYNKQPYLSGYHDYFGFRFDPGSRAQRIEDLLKEYKEDDGEVTLADMKAIQFDHKDLMACRFISILEKLRPAIGWQGDAAVLGEELIAWRRDTHCEAGRNQTQVVGYTLWLKHMMKGYYAWLRADMDKLLGDMSPQSKDYLFADFLTTPFAVQTVYHKFVEGMKSERMINVGDQALEAAALERKVRNLEKTKWGEVHKIEFVNLLEGLLPSLPYPKLPRDGTLTTVDMGGFQPTAEFSSTVPTEMNLPNVWGPSFRLNMVLEPGKPIEAYAALPGGGGSFADQNTLAELFRWNEGRSRKLVEFAE